MEWYYAENGESKGPLSEADFSGLVESGVITAETMVWNEGLGDWCTYGSLQPAGAEVPAEPAPEAASGLSLATPVEEVAGAEVATAACVECGNEFNADEMLQYEGDSVCAGCKPVYFQRIEEGATGTEGTTPNRELLANAKESLKGKWGLAIGLMLLYGVIAFGVSMLGAFISMIPILGIVIYYAILLMVVAPLVLGLMKCYLTISRGTRPGIDMLFSGFQRFGTIVLAVFLMYLIIAGCAIVFILPIGFSVFSITTGGGMTPLLGLVLAVSYIGLIVVSCIVQMMFSQTFFIIGEDESVGAVAALGKSRRMMSGRKWKLFCLFFRIWLLAFLLMMLVGAVSGAMAPFSGPQGAIMIMVIFYILMIGLSIYIAPLFLTAFAHFYNDIYRRNLDS